MDINEAMGITRNPYGHDSVVVREARLAVCNEVERLTREAISLDEEIVLIYKTILERIGADGMLPLIRCERCREVQARIVSEVRAVQGKL